MSNTDLRVTIIRTDGGTQSRVQIRQEAAKWRIRTLSHGTDCAVCGFWIHSLLRLHHIIPVSRGGVNRPENLVYLCPNCHAMVHEMARLLRNRKSGDGYFEFKARLSDLYDDDEVGLIQYYAGQAK